MPTFGTHPAWGWRGALIRVSFLMSVFFLLLISLLQLAPWGQGSNTLNNFSRNEFYLSMTQISLYTLYLFLLSGTLVALGFYILSGPTNTTIIPCITARWYKIYTGLLFGLQK